MVVCDRCGEDNRSGGRFCSSCGAPLPEQRASGFEVRKTVTILFCDAVGSTALGEATDPETTRRVMSRYAETMAGVVRQHGGTVERFRGDEVMAVFGVPVVHEDDALRAVRAAREMQRGLAALNEELVSRWGVQLACRIGINTGEVVAGDPSTGETFVTGDAVNLAKRLEQAAEPGGILIGTATYPLVKDAVTVGPRERFTAKGKRAQADRMRLDDVDASAAGYERRLDAPLVGRERELSELRGGAQRLFDEGRCGVLTLVGPAGVGKSRIARELAAEFEGSARVVTGRCLAYGAGITYWPLVEIVRDLGGLAAIASEVGDGDGGTTALERLGSAVGESELAVPSDELFWGVRRVLEGLARDRPLLICLEDIHWAEPTMLDLIEYVVAFGDGPIVILCAARPDLLDARPGWARYALVELAQLSDPETDRLLRELGVSDPELRHLIATTAEGNPLFAEQLAAVALDAGSDGVGRLPLPASIHALIAARLDSLDPGERRTIERASVVGKEFWQKAVADLSPEADRPQVTTWLLALSRKGLVRPVTAPGPSGDTFRFHHGLIRDVTYAGIPKAIRAELHEAFATWLRTEQVGFGEHDEIVGYHAEQAHGYLAELAPGDERIDALAEQAATLLGAAGRRAFARDDMHAAARLLGRASALARQYDPSWSELRLQLSGALWSMGDRDHADDALEDVLLAATTAEDGGLVWHAVLERAARRGFAHDDDADDLLAVAEEAREAFARTGDSVGLARAGRRLALVHRLRGRFGLAVEYSEEALAHARRAGDGREEGRLVDGLSSALLYGPTSAEHAIERCTELLDEATGKPSAEAAVLRSLCGLVAMQGDFDEARRLYERARRLWQELGLRYALAGLTQVGGELELLAGDPAAAERELRIGAEILETVGGNALQAALLARALARQGSAAEAQALAEGASASAGDGELQAQVIASATRAVLAAARLDDDAITVAETAVARAATTDAPNLQADALVELAVCLDALGRRDETNAPLEAARRLYANKGNRASLGQLDSDWGPALPSTAAGDHRRDAELPKKAT